MGGDSKGIMNVKQFANLQALYKCQLLFVKYFKVLWFYSYMYSFYQWDHSLSISLKAVPWIAVAKTVVLSQKSPLEMSLNLTRLVFSNQMWDPSPRCVQSVLIVVVHDGVFTLLMAFRKPGLPPFHPVGSVG